MIKRSLSAGVLTAFLFFCGAAAYAGQPAAPAAAQEGGIKAWFNKWFDKSKEKTVEVLENREEIAAKAKDKGEKLRGAAEKIASQAQKQRGKGNAGAAAAALQQNAERMGALGSALKDTSETMRDKGGDVLKKLNKQLKK